MKKILFLIAFMAMSAAAVQAQSTTHFGLRVGHNISDVRTTANGAGIGTDVRLSFHGGFALEQEIGRKGVFFETGLYYTSKGACDYGDWWDYDYEYDHNRTMRMTLNYIQMPVLFGYTKNVSRRVALKGFLGGYAAFCTSGKMKQDNLSYDVFGSGMKYVELLGGGGNLKRFDAGLRMGLGVELAKHYSLSFGYEQGLYNINGLKRQFEGGVQTRGYRATTHNRNYTITLGYNF